MSVVRIEKNKDYTIMSNYHFKEKDMSLKAKGLLSLMLSLPNDWDYTVAGLVSICKENDTAIKSALKELQQFGYLQIIKNNPTEENGGRISYDYIVYEKPIQEAKKQDIENLDIENQLQLNTKELNTNNKNNINIINNINSEKPKKQLTEKQKRAIKINEILEEFTDNKEIKNALKAYLKIRKKVGLDETQWKLILEDFRKSYSKKPIEEALDQIKKATIRSWRCLVYNEPFKGTPKSNYSSKPSFDNTANHNIRIYHISDEEFNKLSFEDKMKEMDKFDAVADMTKNQKQFYEQYCLARDENGNLLEF